VVISNYPPEKVFVIVPAFNESLVIRQVIDQLSTCRYTIIIVDDGSRQKLGSSLDLRSGIHLLRHEVNLGQGAALQTGIDYSLKNGAEFIVTFDGDGQHDAKDLPAMLAPLYENEVDITLGSRFVRRGMHNAGFLRRLILRAGRWVNFLFTGLSLTDAHNGLRAVSRKSAERFQLKENRMAHATEILFVIKKNKLRYREIPSTVLYTEYSRSKGQSAFNSIRIFFDLVLHKLFE
jgi:polyprenyl-phospho-N-acetylgalactosaminyl synthase